MLEKLVEEVLRLTEEVRTHKGPPGVVYKIIDPTNQSVRYVGQTVQDIDNRLNGHLSKPVSRSMRAWQEHLSNCGWSPVIEVLEYASRSDLIERERYWIDKLWADGSGEPLLNNGCAKFDPPEPEPPAPVVVSEKPEPEGSTHLTRSEAAKEIFRFLQNGPATKGTMKAGIDGLRDNTAKDALKLLKVRGVAEFDPRSETWSLI